MSAHASTVSVRPDRLRRAILCTGLLIGMLWPICTVEGALANRNRRGLRTVSIEGVLRLAEEEIDIGTAALILSRDWGTTRTLHSYRRRIDTMAETIQKTLRDQRLPTDHRALPIINDYLFEQQGFRAVETADDPEDLFLHVVLDRKRGYCLSLSILYLAIGERLGLPLYGVVVPGHFFVRYDDGRTRLNIETTSNGAIVDDQYYRDKFTPPDRPQSLYMQNLTRRQTLGCFYNNLGNSYNQVGMADEGFSALRRAVELAPQLGEAHTNLGNMYLRRQMYRQAIASYEQALSLLERDAITLNNVAIARLRLRQYTKAEAALKAALQLDPEYIEAYHNLALVYQAQDLIDTAIAQVHRAIALQPERADHYLLLGQINQRAHRLHEAARQFETALAFNPGLFEARIALGAIHLDLDRPSSAITQFHAALDGAPNSVQAYFGLAQAYNALGQIDSEIWAYEEALRIDPHMSAALQNLGNAMMTIDRFDLAAAYYQQAVALDPTNAGLYYNLGVAQSRQDLLEDAIEAFVQAVELDPAGGAAYNGLAIAYYHLHEYELSYHYARHAQRLGADVQEILLQKPQ